MNLDKHTLDMLKHTIKCQYRLSEGESPCDYNCVKPEAIRDSVGYRYDVLYWNFIHAMAEIGHIGAEKYGDLNYQQSKLRRDKSPVNHMANHLRQYINGEKHDKLGDRKYQLAAIAFNAMMEFYYSENKDASSPKIDL